MTAAERITRELAYARFSNGETIGYAHTPSARELDAWIETSTYGTFARLLRTLENMNDDREARGMPRRHVYWYRPVERASDDSRREAVDAIRTIVSRRSGALSPSNTIMRVQAVLDRLREQENHQ